MKKFLTLVLAFTLVGCSSSSSVVSSTKESEEPIETSDPVVDPTVEPVTTVLTVTSTDLVDGVWNSDITSSNGTNRTPELSWNPIEGASEYAVFMIDTTANYWMHWRATGITETHLDAGSNVGEYIGPYPPSGTHNYVVAVFALSAPAQSLPGNFDSANGSGMEFIEEGLGNVIRVGEISGTYTAQ